MSKGANKKAAAKAAMETYRLIREKRDGYDRDLRVRFGLESEVKVGRSVSARKRSIDRWTCRRGRRHLLGHNCECVKH